MSGYPFAWEWLGVLGRRDAAEGFTVMMIPFPDSESW